MQIRTSARRLACLAGAALAATLLSGTAPAAAEPALWVVRDADSTVYLFGTIHVLRPDVNWRSDKIEAAFKASDDLWLEVDEGDDPAVVQGLMIRLGASPQRSLSSRLDEADRTRLQAAAAAAGVPAAALEGMRPWLAALTLTVAPVIKAGYDPNAGVDKVLQGLAQADGRPLRTFESLEQQLRFFADLPEPVELELLRQTLSEAEESTATLDRMAEAWAAGDTKTLEALVVDELRVEHPDVYEVLFTRRNAAWAKGLEQLMRGRGTHFVAVGAGHLLGPDSVQVRLAEQGLTAERR